MTPRRVLITLLATLIALPAAAHEVEEVRYRWHLGGLFGTLARVFLPGKGHGALTTRNGLGGNLEVELDISSPAAEDNEFWRYGAEIDRDDGRTVRAWSAYRYRGRSDEKNSELEELEVIDVASGILLLRRERPTTPRNLRIWNDGKLYPVVILPRGKKRRTIDGRTFETEHYAIRARPVPGERVWKGSLDIFLADDEVATPVEITLERKMARVRLLIDEPNEPAESAGPAEPAEP